MAPIHKVECHTLEDFNAQLQHLHNIGFVNVGHHSPHRLSVKEYLICTRAQCKRCSTSSGLSIVWHAASSPRFFR